MKKNLSEIKAAGGGNEDVLLSNGLTELEGWGMRYRAGNDAWVGLHLCLLSYTALSLQVQCVRLCGCG